MMYSDKLAFAVKVNNRVLRESGENVYLPFGSEYSLLVKNLNSQRAIVHIEIDGKQVCKDGLVVDANSSVDIERFVQNLDVGNKFKFIERTEHIEDTRGIGIEDGLIRVEYEFELPAPNFTNSVYHPSSSGNWPQHSILRGIGGSSLTSSSASSYVGVSQSSFDAVASNSFVADSTPTLQNAGITVPGSVSEQKFTTTVTRQTDGIKRVMVLRLLGVVAERKVKEAVTVKSKPKCVTCGHLNKSGSKFCSKCGTSLEIV